MTTATKRTVADRLRHLSPCSDAIAWADNYTNPAKAWRECRRGDWMLWLIGKQITSEPWSDDRKPLLACALDCAETAKHLWPAKQKEQIAAATGTLRQWIKGKATKEEAIAAADAAHAAADAAAYAARAAADAAHAAADAADAAADAARAAAYAAAYAARAAAYAADAAADAAALALCSDIVRKHFPKPPKVAQTQTRK